MNGVLLTDEISPQQMTDLVFKLHLNQIKYTLRTIAPISLNVVVFCVCFLFMLISVTIRLFGRQIQMHPNSLLFIHATKVVKYKYENTYLLQPAPRAQRGCTATASNPLS